MDKQRREILDKFANTVHKLVFHGEDQSLEVALKNAGVDVNYFSDKAFDGFTKWDNENKRPVIAVNANQPEVRRNFSMAHELGHLIINYEWIPYDPENLKISPNHEIMNVTKYRGGSYTEEEKPEEYVVNEFAAAFLMPDDQLNQIINGINTEEVGYQGLVSMVAKRFNVSEQAASIRIDNFLELMASK